MPTHVEDQLPTILEEPYEQLLSIKPRRADDERQKRKRDTAEILREHQDVRRLANTDLIKQPEKDAGAWRRARHLRRYVATVRKAIDAELIPTRLQKDRVDCFDNEG